MRLAERGTAIPEGAFSFPFEALRGNHPFCDARAARPQLTSSAQSASIAGPALTSIGTTNRGSFSSAAKARKEATGRASPECSITARYGRASGRPARRDRPVPFALPAYEESVLAEGRVLAEDAKPGRMSVRSTALR